MDADFSVELGAEDETLEMPWTGGDKGPRYYDLKHHAEYLPHIEEAVRVPELGEFLTALNSPTSVLETAKCDVWSSTEMNPEEEIFGAAHKFCSYVDFLFSEEASRSCLAKHEQFARDLVELLRKAPDVMSAAEFLIRRCYYHAKSEILDGFYITFYLFGYGDNEPQARQRWAIALKLVENAIKQVACSRR
jgi:hypothetical protein